MRRDGITLIESLVALFIAALGMVALLTLFPLGALQMGQALKDSRCEQSAQEADGLIRWYWSKYETSTTQGSPIQTAFDQGDTLSQAQQLSTTDTYASYPVLVDPLGYVTGWTNANQTTRVAGIYQNFPRRTPLILQTSPTNSANILRFSMMQDDLTFNTAPSPSGAPLTPIERGGRYTWAWLLQRPDNSKRSAINVNVIVYDLRAPFSANAPEQGYDSTTGSTVTFNPGTTSVTLSYSGAKPAIVKGRWIMDATLIPGTNPANTTVTGAQAGIPQANFYRVSSVNDDTPGYLYLELETPIARNDGGTSPYSGTLLVLSGVAEVFTRPQLITGQ